MTTADEPNMNTIAKAEVPRLTKTQNLIQTISQSTLDALVRYSWPGNIRELRNIIERAMILATDSKLRVQVPSGTNGKSVHSFALEDVERQHFLSVLDMTGWRVRGKNGAAEILGLKPTTLSSRMTKLGIKRPAP